jgi:Tfp pilus assembly protein PilF
MRIRAFTTIFLAAAVCVPCWAGGDVSSSGPSVAERLQTAQKAMDSKEWRRALYELEAAQEDEPRNADVFNLLGYYSRKKPDPDLTKAFEYYHAALKINPNHRGAHEYIGEAYLMEKNPEEAEKHLAQLARICGNTQCEEYVDLAKAIATYKARGK